MDVNPASTSLWDGSAQDAGMLDSWFVLSCGRACIVYVCVLCVCHTNVNLYVCGCQGSWLNPEGVSRSGIQVAGWGVWGSGESFGL